MFSFIEVISLLLLIDIFFYRAGWHLVLDVPEEGPRTILPCVPLSSLVQRNLSEIHSAPGRQAAALIRTTDLRSLASPLSAVATATSLAEANPSIGAISGGKFVCDFGVS